MQMTGISGTLREVRDRTDELYRRNLLDNAEEVNKRKYTVRKNRCILLCRLRSQGPDIGCRYSGWWMRLWTGQAEALFICNLLTSQMWLSFAECRKTDGADGGAKGRSGCGGQANHAKTDFYPEWVMNPDAHECHNRDDNNCREPILKTAREWPAAWRRLGILQASHVLINDILDMSKIDGKMKIAIMKIWLGRRLPIHYHPAIHPSEGWKGASLLPCRWLVSDRDGYDWGCDAMRLNQILLNLLSNSLKHEEVSIRWNKTDTAKRSRVRLGFVCDTGYGMSRNLWNACSPVWTGECGCRTESSGNRLEWQYQESGDADGRNNREKRIGKGPPRWNWLWHSESSDNTEERRLPWSHWRCWYRMTIAAAASMHLFLLKNLGIRSDWVLTGEQCVEKACDCPSDGKSMMSAAWWTWRCRIWTELSDKRIRRLQVRIQQLLL